MTGSTPRSSTDILLRLLSRAVEQSPSSVVITNLAGEIEYVNPKFTEVTGYTAEEAVGQNPRILKSGLTPPEVYHELWSTIKAGKEWRGEILNRKKSGETYWEYASISGVMDTHGTVTHFVAVKEDISERKLFELNLQRQNEALSALHRSTLKFLNQHNLADLFDSLLIEASQLLNASYGDMTTLEDGRLIVKAANHHFYEPIGKQFDRSQAKMTWQAIDTLQPVVINDYSSWPQRNLQFEALALQAAISLPILKGNDCLGVMNLARGTNGQPFTEEEIQIGRLFAQIAAMAIENAQLQDTLTDQSVRDPLTGLYNRRYLFETLPREIKRATREDYPVSFVLLDIDLFKHINDQYGHGAGDLALRTLAAHLQSVVRASDILCRYGGDEHIIVMPNANPDAAFARADQIRAAIEQLRPSYQGQELHITISLGVAAYPDHGATIDDVIACADKALYHSKLNGRNQVNIFRC
jgi:diguanylate cyclase (GGDEF)-like protein/PAS domain S-box-containing protein